ncbi:hypothetical protein BaRGS_00022471, partial [Batillaria attramentaria]
FKWLKVVSLLFLTPQYAVLILTMRYVRTLPGPKFVTSTTVLLAEVVKTAVCFLVILVQKRGPRGFVNEVYEHLVCRPWDYAKVCLPSLMFVIQNNLVFVAVSNLDAATFQVTYQLKILTTAVFSVILLDKQLSRAQWFALLLLFLGESIIQVQSARSSVNGTGTGTQNQNPVRGLVAVLVCCCLSGFASVYFERILKGGQQSLWIRNIQLGSSGAVFGAIAVTLADRREGFFYGYDWVVWVVVALQSVGGLLVATVMKYADNILKGFSTAGAILLSCVASVMLFDFHASPEFLIGTLLVLVSLYMYNVFPRHDFVIQPKTIPLFNEAARQTKE